MALRRRTCFVFGCLRQHAPCAQRKTAVGPCVIARGQSSTKSSVLVTHHMALAGAAEAHACTTAAKPLRSS